MSSVTCLLQSVVPCVVTVANTPPTEINQGNRYNRNFLWYHVLRWEKTGAKASNIFPSRCKMHHNATYGKSIGHANHEFMAVSVWNPRQLQWTLYILWEKVEWAHAYLAILFLVISTPVSCNWHFPCFCNTVSLICTPLRFFFLVFRLKDLTWSKAQASWSCKIKSVDFGGFKKIKFSGGPEGWAPAQKWAVPSLIPELIRDVKFQEMCLYGIWTLPPPPTLVQVGDKDDTVHSQIL